MIINTNFKISSIEVENLKQNSEYFVEKSTVQKTRVFFNLTFENSEELTETEKNDFSVYLKINGTEKGIVVDKTVLTTKTFYYDFDNDKIYDISVGFEVQQGAGTQIKYTASTSFALLEDKKYIKYSEVTNFLRNTPNTVGNISKMKDLKLKVIPVYADNETFLAVKYEDFIQELLKSEVINPFGLYSENTAKLLVGNLALSKLGEVQRIEGDTQNYYLGSNILKTISKEKL